MFLNTLAAEFTKLRTTRSFWWTSALFILIGLAWAGMSGASTMEADGGFPTLWAPTVATAVYIIGFPVLMIQAVMLITTEYRYHLQAATYLATPRRWTVALAKLLLYAAFAAALTFVVVFFGFFLAKALAPDSAAALFHPLEDPDALRIMWVYPAAAALVVMISQGIALLLRQTAGTVALMLIWFMGLEQIFRLVPKFGSDIVGYLPFENLNAFVNELSLDGVGWGPGGSGGYFVAWVIAAWVAGVVVLTRRDT
ncbi:MAG: multidrug ABC transporter permease [Corynebacterium sp.]|uniref:multidrug ABC transporter permease n=1 Tax=Corynebacterium sp. TaxID=1720 RepID=UPI0026E09D66|nr:multidrug ABC transporter permease [Corynebacterium sp.]MDO5669357.1 multidrug ABC transporter permease [Corynebacterium sp.]